MSQVWKFPIQVEDEFEVEMPVGAEVLHVGVQNDRPFIWALVDPDAPRAKRAFSVRGTGHEAPFIRAQHLGTFMLADGAFVGHLFEAVSF